MHILKDILKSNQTVFSFKEFFLKWPNINPKALKSKLNYYIKRGDLYHIRRGIYAKDKNYNRFELATKILSPAYISFESVLLPAGIIFQYYTQIFVATYQTREISCDGQTYVFKAIKPTILTNTIGVEIRDTYSIATPERAFLDIVYLNKHYHFDNLDPLDWNKVYEILPIYNNKSMQKRVNAYYKKFKSEMGQ
jgi:predicted transcriptional regulator of viral defense system